MEEQSLVQLNANSAVVANYNAGEVDETGLSDVRLKPETITLIQNTSRETRGAHPGQFVDQLNGKIYDSIVVVPLKIQKTRVMFPPGSDLDTEPLCKSEDGVVPSPYANVKQSPRCASCPQSQWVGGKKPPCNEKRKMLFIIKESGIPRYLTIGGKSIAVFNDVMQSIKEDIQMNAFKGEKLNLYDYYFTLNSQKVNGSKGAYYVARFDDVKRVANVGDFGPLFETYVLQAKHRQQEEEDGREALNAPDPVGETFDIDYIPQQV